ncbi:MAG: AAA family ATPase, partial [Verrucomicrobiales bacterium]|nr:AAA family ATPase [Verrucomicrobiales bacterium]
MKIIKLQTENVKRLQAVEITPGGGNMVVIGGKNGAGKSSVLDSIEFALGGDPSAKMPVRRGEDKARIVVDLGDLVIKRVFTAAGGTSLVVTDADGRKQST